MLDVKRLRILREVAEHGSFSAAADSLHLTQSAVSQQVAALERETGTMLIDRNRGNLRLTDPGAALVSHTEAVIARLDAAERELHEIAGLRGGKVRMASFPTAGATVVIRAVAAFRKQFPEVELTLSEAEPERSIPQLRAADQDVILVYDYESLPLPEERDLERMLLLEERMQLALPKDHRLAGEGTVPLAELAEDTWVVGTKTGAGACRGNVFMACRAAGFEPTIGFESDDYQVHMSLVASGLSVSLVPELLLPGRHPGISIVGIDPDAPVRRVWAVTRPQESRSRATGAMLEILERESVRFAKAR
jgi:molybdate transport repressor ModE-like protein